MVLGSRGDAGNTAIRQTLASIKGPSVVISMTLQQTELQGSKAVLLACLPAGVGGTEPGAGTAAEVGTAGGGVGGLGGQ